jgi:hypothetical protein
MQDIGHPPPLPCSFDGDDEIDSVADDRLHRLLADFRGELLEALQG